MKEKPRMRFVDFLLCELEYVSEKEVASKKQVVDVIQAFFLSLFQFVFYGKQLKGRSIRDAEIVVLPSKLIACLPSEWKRIPVIQSVPLLPYFYPFFLYLSLSYFTTLDKF